MNLPNTLTDKLKALGIDLVERDYRERGYHLEVFLDTGQVRDFAKVMLDQRFYLDFVTAVHVKPCFQVVYQYACFESACRINAKAMASEDGSIPTISDLFHGANWHERETHDFYGVVFDGHPDLRTLLLCEEDHDLNPLLKREDKLLSLEDITRKAVEETDTKATQSPE